MIPTTLIVMSGLPGSGKSTLANGLARELGIAVFSVDPIEGALHRSAVSVGENSVAPYNIAETLAEENLSLGVSVIVDAVNPIEIARAMWRDLAARQHCRYRPIEIVCSDSQLHRRRIEARHRGIPGIPEITWERVQTRAGQYQAWREDRLVLDSATLSPDALVNSALEYVRAG